MKKIIIRNRSKLLRNLFLIFLFLFLSIYFFWLKINTVLAFISFLFLTIFVMHLVLILFDKEQVFLEIFNLRKRYKK